MHGNVAKLRCKRCGNQVDKDAGSTTCSCGGKLVSSVVDFGQSLPEKDVDDAFRHAQQCDLLVVVGSSLVVTPAADVPVVAYEHGARLVIINQGETPLDDVARLRFEERIDEVLLPAVARLKRLMGR